MQRLVLPIFLAMLPLLASAGTEAPEARRLFDTTSVPAAATRDAAGPREAVVRARSVRASTTLIPAVAADRLAGRDARFVLDLFDDVEVVANVVAVDETMAGSVAIEAEIAAAPGGRVVLLQSGDVITGSVNFAGNSYAIRTDATGLQSVQQVDTARLPPELPPRTRVAPPTASAPAPAAAPDVPQDSGRLIDLMVVYTPMARSQAGGTTQIENLIRLGVTETNTAYRNSGIAQRLRLVHLQEIAFTETGNMGNDLDSLSDSATIDSLRNAHGADLVKLVAWGNYSGCGIAWMFSHTYPSPADLGFSVTSWDCISPNYTFGHELGHNMGADHDVANAFPPTFKPYNRGYSPPPGTGWRDIMAYPSACPGGCPRVLAFSNPRITSWTAPIGPMGTAATHNNAQVLNLTAKTIANYRPTNALHPVAQRFTDVPKGHILYGHVEFMAQSEITTGCATGLYCPDQPVTRRQMAVFLERAMRASNFTPPPATGMFDDVAPASQFANFIEALRNDEVTLGCAPGAYCPEASVTREQMALFILRARCGSGYVPAAPASATFADVPTSHPSFAQIEKLVSMGITGGCASGPARYCPTGEVTRAQMAAFIERGYPLMFGLAPVEACTP